MTIRRKRILSICFATVVCFIFFVNYSAPIKRAQTPVQTSDLPRQDEGYVLTNINLTEARNKTKEPILYIVTPTYYRPTQAPDLTRLAQTLMHVKSLHWIIIEDSFIHSPFVKDLVQRLGFNHTLLLAKSTERDKKKKVRGCSQRNTGLKWIKENIKDGVMYFADDDNAYDMRLFEDIRYVKKIGFTPTGNFRKAGVSTAVVKHGKIVSFLDPWMGPRKYPVDMASLSINIGFWLERGAPMFYNRSAGYMESKMIQALKTTMDEMEPRANNCTLIMAWHTRTVSNYPAKNYTLPKNMSDTNIPHLLERYIKT